VQALRRKRNHHKTFAYDLFAAGYVDPTENPLKKALEDIVAKGNLEYWCTGCKMAMDKDHKHWSMCIPLKDAREADDLCEVIDIAKKLFC
jgi:hypothetical protein